MLLIWGGGDHGLWPGGVLELSVGPQGGDTLRTQATANPGHQVLSLDQGKVQNKEKTYKQEIGTEETQNQRETNPSGARSHSRVGMIHFHAADVPRFWAFCID